MAQKIITIYTDDLTGEESDKAQTHTLMLDGIGYEIDLGPDSHEKLLKALRPFTDAGRRIRGAAGATRRTAAKAGKTGTAGGSGETAKIRAWAKENGYEVNERGRVSADIREAYRNANK